MRRLIVRVNRLVGVFAFAFAMLVTQFSGVQFAHAATTDVWTGTAGDGKFSTATNWQSGVVPVNGDVLAFDVSSLTAGTMVNNDMTGLSLAGINFSGSNANYAAYIIIGNTITLTGDMINTATVTISGSTYPISNAVRANLVLAANINTQDVSYAYTVIAGQTVDTAGYNLSASASACSNLPQLVGSGSLNLSGSGANFMLNQPNPNFSGAINISSGVVYAQAGTLGDASGATNVSGTGSLSLYASADSSWSEPLVLSGSGSLSVQHASPNGCSGGGSDTSIYTATLIGPVVLQSDFKYSGSDNLTVTGTYTNNSHAFTVTNGASGKLNLPTGVVQAAVTKDTYSDSQPNTNLFPGYNETAVLDGERGAVQVFNGGTLMGTGTAQSLYVGGGGIVAPGHSPGKLTVTQSLNLAAGSIYQAQLQNATVGGYDQIQVSDPSRTTGNDVTIDPAAILNVSLYKGYAVNKGDKFTIINNLQPSTQKVTGTFSTLPEGTQLVVGGIVFSISYVGGDGNDVVLTALNTGADPTPPNTGVARIIMANPALVAGMGILAAGILFIAARRRHSNKV